MKRFSSGVFAPLGFIAALVQAIRTRARIVAFQERAQLAVRFPQPKRDLRRPTVVAVVTHLAGIATHAADPIRSREETVERLERTLDGLLESLSETKLVLVVNTLSGRNTVADLPGHLRSRVLVREHQAVEPMFLGFEAQQEFVHRSEAADWFIYLEDDIVVRDALLLEKLEYFNGGAPPEALLLPHRFEFSGGRKTYIDLLSKGSPEFCAWNRLTVLEIGRWQFAEFANPHSAFFCLSRVQLARWLATGRQWKGKISYMDALVSAATGCLGEAFRLYKPHPANLGYLEVRHWDSKYSQLYERLHGAAALQPPN